MSNIHQRKQRVKVRSAEWMRKRMERHGRAICHVCESWDGFWFEGEVVCPNCIEIESRLDGHCPKNEEGSHHARA